MRRKKTGGLLILTGLALLLGALLLTGANLLEDHSAAAHTEAALEALEQSYPELKQAAADIPTAPLPYPQTEAAALPDYVENPEIEMPVAQVDTHSYIGILSIPAIKVTLPVISQCSDENLRYAPCRYAGSVYLDDLVIAAHNYRAHFGSLGALRLGDSVSFTDMDGNAFFYEVADIELLPETAVEEMTAGEWSLTLFTCTLGREKRITIRCDRISD